MVDNKKLRWASVLIFVGLVAGGALMTLLIKMAIHAGYIAFPPMIFVS